MSRTIISQQAKYVRALYDYNATVSSCLSFKKGDVILVNFQDDSGWWDGALGGSRGWFPSNYVEICQTDPEPDLADSQQHRQSVISSRSSSRSLRSLLGSSLPANWELLATSRGQASFRNLVTGETALTVEELFQKSVIFVFIAQRKQQQHNRYSIASSTTSSNQRMERSPDTSSIKEWETVISAILKTISDLNTSLKAGSKKTSLEQSHFLTMQIQNTFTFEINDTQVTPSPILITHYEKVVSKLAKLVVSSNIVNGGFPPPDSLEAVRYQTGQVLLCIRGFVTAAQSAHLSPLDSKVVSTATFQNDLAKWITSEFLATADFLSNEILSSMAVIVNMIAGSRLPVENLAQNSRQIFLQVGALLSHTEVMESVSIVDNSTDDASILQTLRADLASLIATFQSRMVEHQVNSGENGKDLLESSTRIINLTESLADASKKGFKIISLMPHEHDNVVQGSTLHSESKNLWNLYQTLEKTRLSQKQGRVLSENNISLHESQPEYRKSKSADTLLSTEGKNKTSIVHANALSTSNDFTITARNVVCRNDPQLRHSFLVAFHIFGSAQDLLREIKNVFEEHVADGCASTDTEKASIFTSIGTTLLLWLERYWVDYLDDNCLEAMFEFANGPFSTKNDSIAQRLVEQVKKMLLREPTGNHFQEIKGDIPRPILPKARVLSLLDLDPLEVARQLTLIESSIFLKIKPHELVKQEWSVKKRTSNAKNVRLMTSLSTKISGWVAKTILAEVDVRKRGSIMKFFIKLIQKLMFLSNFNAVMSVKSALQSSAISRLKRTWATLSDKHRASFEVISQATDHSRNFNAYRMTLKNAPLPCLPFLGLFLTDLTFLDESHQDTLNEGQQINMEKWGKLYHIIDSLQQYQTPFLLQEVKEIKEYLLNSIQSDGGYDSEQLYQLSLDVEPRETRENNAQKLEKTMDMLQRTGLL